jgi:hypothetical protein
MLQYALTIMALGILFSGCLGPSESPQDKFLSKGDDLLRQRDAGLLEGPYRIRDVPCSDRILIEADGQDVEVIIRGCMPTGDEKMDFKAGKQIGTLLGPYGVYIRTDCKQVVGEKLWKGVVYKPANTIGTVDENLKIHIGVLTYTMPQLLNLAYGYSLLDTSDTDYPLYEVFREAERVARENRNGYWATHAE